MRPEHPERLDDPDARWGRAVWDRTTGTCRSYEGFSMDGPWVEVFPDDDPPDFPEESA